MRFFSYVLSPRGLGILLVVVAACFLTTRYSAHHSGEGLSVFQKLYMHLMPAALVEPSADSHGSDGAHGEAAAHGHPLVSLTLPLPAKIDGDPSAEGTQLVLFNLQIFQVAAVLLCFVCFMGVPRYLRTGKGDPVSKVFAGFAMWLRDEVVYPEMGKEMGRRFLPYFLTVVFFHLCRHLRGLAPNAVTPTASIFVTGALALTTFIAMLVCGMAAQGVGAFWKNLVPHVPAALWPLMFVVEVVGLLVKPFALMIRLFANMSGGHMVVLSFMGLIFFLGQADMWGAAGGWGASPVGVGFAVFIMIIEAFVACLQAFIFTQLSVIFVNAAVHPEH
jgi:ATP synthase subunit 6